MNFMTNNFAINDLTDISNLSENEILLNFQFADKEKTNLAIKAEIGQTLLDIANKVQKLHDLLPGNCGGVAACATCHVVIAPEWFVKLNLGQNISEDEENMLDQAFGLESTSRLGCQITLTKDMHGLIVKVPNEYY